ncbi:lysine-2,3-aminomutase-like protein [Radicibacter daui]|uniref:lysine-2,3-aminomutase-like protein n=1 Tax=Radicibacter daui TaxID=3064829 RepID=UPI0040470224
MTRSTLTSLAALEAAGLLSAEEAPALEPVAARYAVAVTPHVAALALAKPEGPVALQFVPDARELYRLPEELDDPISDEPMSPVKGIVHRYPDRVLLKALHACPVYCRFCFRREMVGPGGEGLSNSELDAALDYIRTHEEVWEVVMTGGDPLMLSPRRLALILDALAGMEHVGSVRLHTRVPVVDPERVNGALLQALRPRDTLAVWLAVHTNHADELVGDARRAIGDLANAGIALVSQSVLLKGINDDVAVLEKLFRTLVTLRVKPYYLHHPDLAPGTSHFRITLAEGQALMRALRGRLSGLAQPTYVWDPPGGSGKIPVGPDFLASREPPAE